MLMIPYGASPVTSATVIVVAVADETVVLVSVAPENVTPDDVQA